MPVCPADWRCRRAYPPSSEVASLNLVACSNPILRTSNAARRRSPGSPCERRRLATSAHACYSIRSELPRLRPAGEEFHLPSALGGQDVSQKVIILKHLEHRHHGARPYELSRRGPSAGTSNVAMTRASAGAASAWPSSAPGSCATRSVGAPYIRVRGVAQSPGTGHARAAQERRRGRGAKQPALRQRASEIAYLGRRPAST